MYYFSNLKTAIFCACIILFLSSTQQAQTSKAFIDKISIGPSTPQLIIDDSTQTTGGKVLFQRKKDEEWKDTHPGLELETGNRLQLKPYTSVDVHFEGNQQGQMTLFPAAFFKQAIFSFKEDPDTVGNIQVKREYGATVIHWIRGFFSFLAEGHNITVEGTKFSLFDHPEGNKTILLIEEGSVCINDTTDNDTTEVKAGEYVILAPGVIEGPFVEEFTKFQRIMDYNMEVVWSTNGFVPFYRKPVFYIPAAAVLIGGGAYLIIRDGKEDSALPGPPDLPK